MIFLMIALMLGDGSRDCGLGTGLVTDPEAGTVSFDGVLRPDRYNALLSFPKHHHFIVYAEGRAARNALITTTVPDLEIQAALRSIGAVPGDNLTRATWEARHDPASPDPDLRVAGTPLTITLCRVGEEPAGVERFLIDRGGEGFDFRFGGHADLVPVWRSGCIVCLESCPGGRVSNAAYTLRDHASGRARFDEAEDLPAAGTPIRITLRLTPGTRPR